MYLNHLNILKMLFLKNKPNKTNQVINETHLTVFYQLKTCPNKKMKQYLMKMLIKFN